MLEAVKVLLPRLYTPAATKCRAGVAATMDRGSCVTNVEKVLYTVMAVVFAVAVRLPMANKGRNTAGRPGVAAGGACGTMSGLAASDLRSMVSAPMRITPAL